MPLRRDPVFRATSYLCLLAVELSGALILAAFAFLPFLFLKVLFSPAFYGFLVAVLALSLLAILLRWLQCGVRLVEVDDSGFQLHRGRSARTVRVARTEIHEVRIRRSLIVVSIASGSPERRPKRLFIRRDGFPAPEYRELGLRLSALRKRP